MRPLQANRPRLLVADDQADVLEALRLLLSQHDYALDLVTSPRAVLAELERSTYDLLLVDLNYSRDTTSGEEGLRLLSDIRRLDSTLPVVVMTAWGNIELAVDAMRGGATSFVQKPWDNAALVQIVARDIAESRAVRERNEARAREQQDALTIQRALLPSTFPATDWLQMAGAWLPAAGVGGDCYDAFQFDADSVALTIADVAGKGLPAALLMSSLQASVRAFARKGAAAQSICASVNRLLCGHMVPGRFATFCYLTLDGRLGVASYSNAGHNPPLLVRASGDASWLSAGGTVLGVFPEAQYAEGQATIAAGDRLVLYTDGITEARNDTDEEYGDRRLCEAVVRNRSLDAGALHAALLETVNAFTGGIFQDDATLIVVEVAPAPRIGR